MIEGKWGDRLNFIKRNQIPLFFVLTFLISWGFILVLIAINGMPTTMPEAQAQLPLTIMVFLCGPLVSGLLMIGLVDGRKGFHELLSRLTKWRVSFAWYAVALLTAPSVFALVHYLLFQISPVYSPGFLGPNVASMILQSILSGIVVGICEEIGWSGFVIPKVRLRHSILTTGLMVGVIWGAWHIMANDIWAIRAYSGGLNPVVYAVLAGVSFLIGQLPPYRLLMVWVYDNTDSLLIMMMMHSSLTTCSIAFSPTSMAGWQVFIYSLSVAAATWFVAGVVVWVNRKHLLRR